MALAEKRPTPTNSEEHDLGEARPQSRSTDPAIFRVSRDLANLIHVASSALNQASEGATLSEGSTFEPAIGCAKVALQQASALVRETIETSRGNDYDLDRANVRACLAEVETLVRGTWDPGVRIELSMEAALPLVQCDRQGLQNAILSLLFNAREAMPKGGTIRIGAAAAFRGASGMVVIRIEDDGIGMTPETTRQAFDPFFTTKGKGLGGVGLPMVRRFVEQNDGSVDIESALGLGTAVIVRLPVARPAVSAWQ